MPQEDDREEAWAEQILKLNWFSAARSQNGCRTEFLPFFHEYKFRARISRPPANVVRAVNTPEKSLFCEWRNLNKYDNEADFSHTKRSIRFAFLVMLRTNQAPSQVQKRFSFFMFWINDCRDRSCKTSPRLTTDQQAAAKSDEERLLRSKRTFSSSPSSLLWPCCGFNCPFHVILYWNRKS